MVNLVFKIASIIFSQKYALFAINFGNDFLKINY